MFIARIETSDGPMTIGMLDIEAEQMDSAFNALVNTLTQVTDPIVVTSTDTFVLEAPPGTPATLTFKYLGLRSAEFVDQEAFGASMNEHFARGVFQCAVDFEVGDDMRITGMFEYFEQIVEDDLRGAAPSAH